MVAKLREDRRRKKLERGIRKLQSYERVLRPIEELESDRRIAKEAALRKRDCGSGLSEDEKDARLAITRRWQQYVRETNAWEMRALEKCVRLQEEALRVLRSVDRVLYDDCLRKEPQPPQMVFIGPRQFGPCEDVYDPPQGDYDETTNTFEKGYKITVLDKKTVKEEMFEQLKLLRKKRK